MFLFFSNYHAHPKNLLVELTWIVSMYSLPPMFYVHTEGCSEWETLTTVHEICLLTVNASKLREMNFNFTIGPKRLICKFLMMYTRHTLICIFSFSVVLIIFFWMSNIKNFKWIIPIRLKTTFCNHLLFLSPVAGSHYIAMHYYWIGIVQEKILFANQSQTMHQHFEWRIYTTCMISWYMPSMQIELRHTTTWYIENKGGFIINNNTYYV